MTTLVAALMLGLSAGPALAGSTGEGLPNGGVHFTADEGESPNRVTITPVPGGFRIRDDANDIGTGTCDQPDPRETVCDGTRLEVFLKDGNDVLVLNTAAPGGTQVLGGTGSDDVTGSSSADVIDGEDGVDVLRGGLGNDNLQGGIGNDTTEGGAGRDAVNGGGGDDSADGGDDDDTVSGGPGSDNVTGGPGNDSLRGLDSLGMGTDGGDGLDGGPGNDSLSGEGGDDTLGGGDGADAMSGGPGIDAATFERQRAPVVVTLDDQPGDGPSGEGDNVASDVENVTGGDDENTLTGSAAANTLRGAGGEDYVDGAAAGDTLATGGSGDTVRSRDGERDLVQCGDGPDFAIADPQDSVTGECERIDVGNSRARFRRTIVVEPTAATAQGTTIAGVAMQLAEVSRFVPLVDRVGVPVGTALDTSAQAVRLRSAPRRGRGRNAVVSGGTFRMSQSRTTGLTTLALRGGDFSQCASTRAKDAGAAQRRVIRRLRGRTRGRHRVRGRFSAGTTRGTGWIVEDRCDATVTRVLSGRVAVRDFARRRTVVLRRGQRYVARAPR